MKIDKFFHRLKQSSQNFLLIFICLLAFIFGWQGNFNNIARATILDNNIPLIADFDNSSLQNQLEGKGKQIQGSIQEGFGKTQSKFEDVADQANRNAEETTKELTKNTERYLNKTQNKAESVGDKVQDAAENAQDQAEGVIESIKDFFNQ